MKKSFLLPFFLSLGLVATGFASFAPLDGDVFLGFRDTTSPNSSSLILDIGSLDAIYSSANGTLSLNTGKNSAANIVTDLAGKFGANWYTSGNVKMSLFGGYNAASDASGVLGTIAASDAGFPPLSNIAILGRTSSTPFGANPASLGALISSVRGNASWIGSNPSTDTAHVNGWLSAAGNNNAGSWDSFQYGTGLNLYANNSLGANAFQTYGGSVEAALNSTLYASIYADDNTTTPAFPTQIDLAGSFSLSSNGSLSYSAVPEPSTYALLALGFVALLVAARRSKISATTKVNA